MVDKLFSIANRLSHDLFHFVTGLAKQLTVHKMSGRPMRAGHRHQKRFASKLEIFLQLFPILHFLNWWSSTQRVATLCIASAFFVRQFAVAFNSLLNMTFTCRNSMMPHRSSCLSCTWQSCLCWIKRSLVTTLAFLPQSFSVFRFRAACIPGKLGQ